MIPVKHIDPDDLALYAMQLLSPEEMQEMTENLQHSAEARRQLAEIYNDLALYAHTTEMQAAPEGARQKLMKAVAREPKMMRERKSWPTRSVPSRYTGPCEPNRWTSASTITVRAAMITVRPYGRVILMGGVGMLGGPGLEIPYPWLMRNLITIRGQWMYSPSAVSGLANLIHAGLLDLNQFSVSEFPLEEANQAVAHASESARPFHLTVIQP